MATLTKIALPSGTVRWRAIVKAKSRQVASRNFASKTAGNDHGASRAIQDDELSPCP